jgi:hypothetical protein
VFFFQSLYIDPQRERREIKRRKCHGFYIQKKIFVGKTTLSDLINYLLFSCVNQDILFAYSSARCTSITYCLSIMKLKIYPHHVCLLWLVYFDLILFYYFPSNYIWPEANDNLTSNRVSTDVVTLLSTYSNFLNSKVTLLEHLSSPLPHPRFSGVPVPIKQTVICNRRSLNTHTHAHTTTPYTPTHVG